jgi:hypothetical protein
MASRTELERLLQSLEEHLLEPTTGKDAAQLEKLLCDDFVEFGACGGVFDKRSILVALSSEVPALYTISEFNLLAVSEDTALVTYRLSQRATPSGVPTESLRSSSWRNVCGQWKMFFHQGTRAA